MTDEQVAQMRAFLGRVATEVLSWPRVDSVSVRLEHDYAIEGNNYNGVVDVRLWGTLRYGRTFSWTELTYINDPQLLIDRLRKQHSDAIGKQLNAIVDVIRSA